MKKTARFQTTSILFADETKVHPALKNYFGYALFKANARFRALMTKALAPQGLQTFHLGILKVLETSGPISQIQLGEEMGIDKASMVKLIDQLEKLKFVERQVDPKDRRIKNVKMTALGLKRMNVCKKLKEETEDEFFKKLSRSQRQTLRQLIIELIN